MPNEHKLTPDWSQVPEAYYYAVDSTPVWHTSRGGVYRAQPMEVEIVPIPVEEPTGAPWQMCDWCEHYQDPCASRGCCGIGHPCYEDHFDMWGCDSFEVPHPLRPARTPSEWTLSLDRFHGD